MVERWFPKPDVRGSNPFSPEKMENICEGEMAEWSIALIC